MEPRGALPTTFRDPRLLGILNTAAVGLALGSLVGASFEMFWSSLASDLGRLALITGIPSLVVGTLWAHLLRLQNTISRFKIRTGWVVSVPLAMLNAALAAGALLGTSEHSAGAWLGGMLLGATFGVMFWLPALLLVLLLFGAPIAWAQKLAERGLAGQERGELIVGATAASLGLLGGTTSIVGLVMESERYGLALTALFGLLAASSGGTAAMLSFLRQRRRRAFVDSVELGRVPGYRVDETPEGKVLVRVAVDDGYRVAEEYEALVELDHQGEARRALVLTAGGLRPPASTGCTEGP